MTFVPCIERGTYIIANNILKQSMKNKYIKYRYVYKPKYNSEKQILNFKKNEQLVSIKYK